MTGLDAGSKEITAMPVIMTAVQFVGDMTPESEGEMIAITEGVDHVRDPGGQDPHIIDTGQVLQEDEELLDTRGSMSTTRNC